MPPSGRITIELKNDRDGVDSVVFFLGAQEQIDLGNVMVNLVRPALIRLGFPAEEIDDYIPGHVLEPEQPSSNP